MHPSSSQSNLSAERAPHPAVEHCVEIGGFGPHHRSHSCRSTPRRIVAAAFTLHRNTGHKTVRSAVVLANDAASTPSAGAPARGNSRAVLPRGAIEHHGHLSFGAAEQFPVASRNRTDSHGVQCTAGKDRTELPPRWCSPHSSTSPHHSRGLSAERTFMTCCDVMGMRGNRFFGGVDRQLWEPMMRPNPPISTQCSTAGCGARSADRYLCDELECMPDIERLRSHLLE